MVVIFLPNVFAKYLFPMLSSHARIQVPPEILFCRIKIRQIFQWIYLLWALAIAQYIAIFSSISILSLPINLKDRTLSLFWGIEITIFFGVLILKQCHSVDINLDYLIGKVPPKYPWLFGIGITISSLLFSIGSYRISMYGLSFFFSGFVEKQLYSNGLYSAFSNTSAPGIQFLMGILQSFVGLLSWIIFVSFLLHRLAIQWGTKKAILVICLFSITGFPNIFGSVCYFLAIVSLYISSRSLMVPAIAFSIRIIVFYLIGFARFFTDQELTTLAQLQGELWFGIICLVISMPLLVYFFYKNWYLVNEPLPYYINCAKD
jgi:uncharacterized protein